MHVHLSEPEPPEPGAPAWVDDFGSGSAAAIAGGVTTIGNMTFPAEGDTLHQSLDRDLTAASARPRRLRTAPGPVQPDPEALAELPELAAAGHTSLKLFMVAEEFEAQADGMIEAVRIAGQHGMLTLIHCEDGALVRFAGEQLRLAGRGGLRQLGRQPARPGRARRGRPGRRDLRGDRLAGLHRPPVVGAGAAGRAARPVPRPAGVRRDQAAVPAPDQRGAGRAGRREVHRRAAAARAVRRSRAVGRPGRRVGRHARQRPRPLDAARQARRLAGRDDGQAGRRRPGDDAADAVLGRRPDRPPLAGPLRRADRDEPGPPVRPLPAQGNHRRRQRRRPGGSRSAAAPHRRRQRDAVQGRLLGLRRPARYGAGRVSPSAAARSCSRTARCWPGPAAASGCPASGPPRYDRRDPHAGADRGDDDRHLQPRPAARADRRARGHRDRRVARCLRLPGPAAISWR